MRGERRGGYGRLSEDQQTALEGVQTFILALGQMAVSGISVELPVSVV